MRKKSKSRRPATPIRVWWFSDAPSAYRRLFEETGADCIAEVPASYDAQYLPWLLGKDFGCFKVSRCRLRGRELYVGYHE